MQAATETIEALTRRVAELETELTKSRGQIPADRSGLKGAIAQATSRGLPNNFRAKDVDPGKLIEKAAKRSRSK